MILSFVLFGLVFGAALPLRAVIMGEWTATAVFGAVMGVQAAAMAVGRAALPALTGGLHDWLGDYAVAIALLCALLLAALLLVIASDARPAGVRRRELVPAGERAAQPPGRSSPDA
jgi:MFS family permease